MNVNEFLKNLLSTLLVAVIFVGAIVVVALAFWRLILFLLP